MKSTNAFKVTIKKYLVERGSKDPLFCAILDKPGKNMDDCIDYILETVQKSGCNGFTDDEVYNMAVHYFDEDNIKLTGATRNMQVVVNHHVILTDEEKAEARKQAVKELVDQTKKEMTKKVEKVKPDEKKDAIKQPETNTLF